MSLTQELLKTTSIKGSDMIADAKIFTDVDIIRTSIPALNVACSGSMTGGYGSGITIFAAPSKSFKTLFSLIMIKAFQKKHKDGTIIFYDSEFGSPPEYLKAAGLNLDTIIHIPIMNLEEAKFDMIKKLESIKRSDKVLFFIDSIGNLASKKEVEDTKDEKAVADMTRAKQLKSLFRMVTPYLSTLDIPLIAVNHVYSEIGCLNENTNIRMGDNSLVKIKDVEIGDMVATRFGPKVVLSKTTPLELAHTNHKMYEIRIATGEIIKCTGNHKFLVNGIWTRADDLKITDLLENINYI